MLLAGEPGIGKTRLLAELARTVHEQGAVVLAGRSPAEKLVPYQPFMEALRPYLLSVRVDELRASAREYGSELSRLVPELRRRVPELPPAVTGEPETERYRLFEAVIGMLGEIAGATPLLLVLDDLQWADRPSLLLLRHLARAARGAHFLIVGVARGPGPRAASLSFQSSACIERYPPRTHGQDAGDRRKAVRRARFDSRAPRSVR